MLTAAPRSQLLSGPLGILLSAVVGVATLIVVGAALGRGIDPGARSEFVAETTSTSGVQTTGEGLIGALGNALRALAGAHIHEARAATQDLALGAAALAPDLLLADEIEAEEGETEEAPLVTAPSYDESPLAPAEDRFLLAAVVRASIVESEDTALLADDTGDRAFMPSTDADPEAHPPPPPPAQLRGPIQPASAPAAAPPPAEATPQSTPTPVPAPPTKQPKGVAAAKPTMTAPPTHILTTAPPTHVPVANPALHTRQERVNSDAGDRDRDRRGGD